MQIQISIQRPILTMLAVAGIGMWAVTSLSATGSQAAAATQAEDHAIGGEHDAAVIAKASLDVGREQTKQLVLEHKKEIYEYQLQLLEQQAASTQSAQDREKVTQTRQTLLSIIKDRAASEKLLTDALYALWDAQGTEVDDADIATDFSLDQAPVSLTQGISAYFHDNEYKAHFGFDHLATDIRTAQGTEIHAPADGVVVQATDNGLGYSYITLAHADGQYQTVYGHVSRIDVRTGDAVHAGDIIGLSGGAVGARGSGPYTTGSHLHFAMKHRGSDGKYRLIDPLPYLLHANGRIVNDQMESGV